MPPGALSASAGHFLEFRLDPRVRLGVLIARRELGNANPGCSASSAPYMTTGAAFGKAVPEQEGRHSSAVARFSGLVRAAPVDSFRPAEKPHADPVMDAQRQRDEPRLYAFRGDDVGRRYPAIVSRRSGQRHEIQEPACGGESRANGRAGPSTEEDAARAAAKTDVGSNDQRDYEPSG